MGHGPTLGGGALHSMARLTTAEREAAKNALEKIKSLGSSLGSHLDRIDLSATVYGGSSATATGLRTPTLIHGQGSDTFVGGARNLPVHATADLARDTVVGGSVTPFSAPHAAGEVLDKHGAQSFSLSNETINVLGTTAESVKGTSPHDSATSAHTITLADKTTITISGLSHEDVSKLKH